MQDELRRQLIDLIPELRRRAFRLTRNRADSDDLLHTTLEKGLRKLHAYRPTGTFRGWLMQIMQNAFIDEVRRTKVQPSVTTDGEGDVVDLLPVSENQFHTTHLREVAREIEKLPSPQRRALERFALEGASYEDAADAVGVPIGTIRSRLFRARENLRNRIE
jgi:RNA polymerase sigma-70 factor (ECF subfamily)